MSKMRHQKRLWGIIITIALLFIVLIIGIFHIQQLNNIFRTGDVVARLGGDEFVILLPRITSLDVVRKKARLILLKLSRQNLPELEGAQITASIGTARPSRHCTRPPTRPCIRRKINISTRAATIYVSSSPEAKNTPQLHGRLHKAGPMGPQGFLFIYCRAKRAHAQH